MPIKNRPDPEYEPESQFDTFADGKHPVTGITWITNDEEGAPIFVANKGRTPLVARYRSILESEESGPPGSVSPAEVIMLVKAFGGDPSKLPDREVDPTAFLMAARDQINNSDKVVSVTVSSGWINHVPGMNLPPDKYFTFQYAGITTKNDEDQISWKEGQYGKWFGANLRVVGDLQLRSTPYDGYEQFVMVSYGLTVNEQGTPEYATRVKEGTSQKVWTSAAVGFSKFVAAFAPQIEQADFQDVHNILPELNELGLREQRRAVGQVTRSKTGFINVNISSLASIEEAPLPMPEDEDEKPAERDVEDEVKETDTLGQIYDLIDTGAGKGAFSNGSLNAKGKQWCKEHLKPFLTEHGMKARMDAWTDEEQKKVLSFLRSEVGAEEEDEF